MSTYHHHFAKVRYHLPCPFSLQGPSCCDANKKCLVTLTLMFLNTLCFIVPCMTVEVYSGTYVYV